MSSTAPKDEPGRTTESFPSKLAQFSRSAPSPQASQEAFMRSAYRAFNFVMVASLFFQQFSTIPAHAQQSQQQSPQARAFDPFVNRVRDGLKLNDEQVATLRQILARHAPRVNELRQRAQSNPYAPMLGQEVDKEQRAIREELAEVLDEQQKGLLASFDARVPIQ